MIDTDPARWRRLSELFDRALDLEPDARRVLLDGACADDPELRVELEAMLAADDAGGLLDAGVGGMAAAIGPTTAIEDEDAQADLGQHLGHWQLERVLGRGGMGTVYAARRDDRDTHQRAAVKRLHRRWDGSLQAQRFLQERRILAALSHPNLPRLIDHGTDADARPWFALEYVDGGTLTEWADAHRLDLRERIDLFRQVCAAVQHAHEHFVVHRDLKPANILVDEEGHPKVLDFGVAKRMDDAAGATRTGAFAGFTPEYAAPEQISGGTVSAATDVYALGVILYQLLAGRLPLVFDHDDLQATAEAITSRTAARLDQAITTGTPHEIDARLQQRGVDLRRFRRFVRGDLSRIVQTALAKEPQRRYASVQAFSSDLKRFLDGRTVSVSGDTFAYRTRKFVRRNRWGVAMASLAMFALVGGSIGMAWQAELTKREAMVAVQVKDYLIDMFRQVDLQANTHTSNARAVLDTASVRLQELPADSALRHELLAVLLGLYNERAFRDAGLRLAQREMPDVPTWRGDGVDAARLRTLLAALRLRKDDGDGEAAGSTLQRALATYPDRHSVEYAEAMTVYGEIHGDAGLHVEAARWHAGALKILRGALPKDDDRVLYGTVLLAGAVTSQRRLREGRALTERALDDTPSLSVLRPYICTMAALRRAVFGEFASADVLFEEARRIQAQRGIERLSEYYVTTRATNAFSLGELARARADVDQGIADQLKRESGTWPGALSQLLWLHGEIALADRDYAGAADYWAKAARLQRDARDTGLDTVYFDALHAIALAGAGRTGDASRVLDRAESSAHIATPSYASAMFRAAQGVVSLHRDETGVAVVALKSALDELAAARRHPADVHNQLRENRDAVRIRAWLAQAHHASGDDGAASATLAEAQRIGMATLGSQHPFVREVERLTVAMEQPASARIVAKRQGSSQQ